MLLRSIMEHDLGSEFATMKERAMDKIIREMGIAEPVSGAQDNESRSMARA